MYSRLLGFNELVGYHLSRYFMVLPICCQNVLYFYYRQCAHIYACFDLRFYNTRDNPFQLLTVVSRISPPNLSYHMKDTVSPPYNQ